MMLSPSNYKNPEWPGRGYKCVHEWTRYANADLRAIWPTFSDAQKLCIAETLQDLADAEHWE